MPYQDRVDIPIHEPTREALREATDELDLSYDEFIQKAIAELTES